MATHRTTAPPSIQGSEFIKFVINECHYYGVTPMLRNVKYVLVDKQPCAGYFDQKTKTLACSMKRDDALSILAHEYCHLTQWAEKAPIWIAAMEAESYEAWAKHLAGEAIEMDEHFCLMRDLELDNERRTVALIKRMGLPIDISTYIRKANAYVMFYNYMRITGRWCSPKNSPYNNPAIYGKMPDRFSLNYTKMSARIEKLFRDAGL